MGNNVHAAVLGETGFGADSQKIMTKASKLLNPEGSRRV